MTGATAASLVVALLDPVGLDAQRTADERGPGSLVGSWTAPWRGVFGDLSTIEVQPQGPPVQTAASAVASPGPQQVPGGALESLAASLRRWLIR